MEEEKELPPSVHATPEPAQPEERKASPSPKLAVDPNSADRLQSILARCRDPLSETTVTLEVRGVYSLPDAWVSKAVRAA